MRIHQVDVTIASCETSRSYINHCLNLFRWQARNTNKGLLMHDFVLSINVVWQLTTNQN